MVKQSTHLFLFLLYMLPEPKELWYVHLLNRQIPKQWHCERLKHTWMWVFFLYFVQSFTVLPKRQCVFFWALNIQLMFACFIHVSAELAGHLPAWLLIHGSFRALLLPRALRLFSLTLSKAPAHNISFSVLSVIKMKATTEKMTSLKHVVHTVQWLALDLFVQHQTSLH